MSHSAFSERAGIPRETGPSEGPTLVRLRLFLARAGEVWLVPSSGDSFEPVAQHLSFVPRFCLSKRGPVCRHLHQGAAEQLCVLQGNVGTLATTGRHGVDGIAQKCHVRRVPLFDGPRRGDRDGKGCRNVGLVDEPAQRGVPFLYQAARMLVQRWPIRVPPCFAEREGPREVPRHVREVQRRGELRGGSRSRCHLPACRHAHSSTLRAGYTVETVDKDFRNPVQPVGPDRRLAVDGVVERVDPGIRRDERADHGKGSVGAHQQIAGSRSSIGEGCPDQAALHLVKPFAGLAKMHNVLQAGKQNFAQRESVDPEALLTGDRRVWQWLGEFQMQLLVQEHQPCGSLDGSRHTELEEILRQTVAQGLTALFLYADSVPLPWK